MGGKLLALLCLVAGVACEEHIVLGMGCFFKAKKTFEEANESGKLKLEKIEQGYAGGFFKNPDYLAVMKGRTGHAEVLRLAYNEKDQPLKGIMSEFWHGHDPTSRHIQGDEVGSQYRSLVLYETDDQNTTVFDSLAAFIAESDVLEGKARIQTEVFQLDKFWPAEGNLSVVAPDVEKIIKKEHDDFLMKVKLEKEQNDELTVNLDPSSRKKAADVIKKIKAKVVVKEDGEEEIEGDAEIEKSESSDSSTSHDEKSDSSSSSHDSDNKEEGVKEDSNSKESEEDKDI